MPIKFKSHTEKEGSTKTRNNPINDLIFGLILLPLVIIILFTNELRAAQTYNALREGEEIAVALSSAEVEDEQDGNLVHMTAYADTDETLIDQTFSVSASNVIKLNRNVKMYQWVEKRETSGSGEDEEVTYTYSKRWSSKYHNSKNFHRTKGHENPPMEFRSTTHMAEVVEFGEFLLSPGLIKQISGDKSLEIRQVPELDGHEATLANKGVYIGSGSLKSPELGDYHITFSVVHPVTVSIIAQQRGTTFQPYQTQAGDTLEMLEMGNMSKEQMFQIARSKNMSKTWGTRLGGTIFMFVAIYLIFRPIVAAAHFVPLLGNLIELGITTLTFALGTALSILVIGLGWIAARPTIGFFLLMASIAIISAAVFFGMQKKEKRKKAKKRAAKKAQAAQ